MKHFILSLGLLFSLNAMADIEYNPVETKVKPTASRVETTRSCWHELQAQGCGDPGEDLVEFRSCMNNSFESLTDTCQALMTKLYGKK